MKILKTITLILFSITFGISTAGASTKEATNSYLYFPHIACVGNWQTGIAIINPVEASQLTGTLRAFDNDGTEIDNTTVSLGSGARVEMNIADTFKSPASIAYLILEHDSANVCGYAKFWIEGRYRAAVPAVTNIDDQEMIISHIASDSMWWTGIGLLNAASSARELTITFNTGQTKTVSLAAGEHKAFTIKSLFENQALPDIHFATITGGNDVAGLELFSKNDTSSNEYLSGIALNNNTADTIFYPYATSDSASWTAIAACNPSGKDITLTITPYTSAGTALTTKTVSLQAGKRFAEAVSNLGLSAKTAWLSIEGTEKITGFALIGSNDEQRLGGCTTTEAETKKGVFADIKNNGLTTISLVNTGTKAASVTLNAYSDDATIISTTTITVNGHGMIKGHPENIFSNDISGASYIGYSSAQKLVGMQLTTSSDNTMMDGLPSMGTITESITYALVDTGQVNCYDDDGETITCPEPGENFYGQDAQFSGNQPSYTDNGDGTITDNVTGLIWQQVPVDNGFSYPEAVEYCDSLELAGYDDWRIPSTKELFTISNFAQGWPYLDTDYFSLAGSSVSKDEQYWTEKYVGTTVEGRSDAAFGINHGTGHIKAYPASVSGPRGNYVRAVRGNSYGVNNFENNGDGTVTDQATGLMWQQADSGSGLDWEAALAYAANSTLAGYSDWHLPNIKELQSIVDYTHSPSAEDEDNLGPAIDTDYFEITPLTSGTTDYTPDYGYFWSSTSAYFGGDSREYYYAWYVAFGTAVNNEGADFHGAGAIRFDTKTENGPLAEGGERYYNYVRLVRK